MHSVAIHRLGLTLFISINLLFLCLSHSGASEISRVDKTKPCN
jgi:hypothetical protein